MTRNHTHHQVGHNSTTPERTPRLRLKPKAPQSGFVDGAWWPHTDFLPAELPDLLAVLSVRLGPIERVLYNLDEWSASPGKVVIGDRVIRLGGYRYQPPNSIEVLGLNRSRITLLVVPPGTDPKDAHATMMTAAAAQNASSVASLLTRSDQERSDSDGGSPLQPATTGLLAETTHS